MGLAADLDLLAVITNAVRYLDPAQSRVADVLDSARLLMPIRPDRTCNGERTLKNHREMAALAEEVARAAGQEHVGAAHLLATTARTATDCRLDPASDLGIEQVHFPEEHVVGVAPGTSARVLRERCDAAMVRHGYDRSPIMRTRLEEELRVRAARRHRRARLRPPQPRRPRRPDRHPPPRPLRPARGHRRATPRSSPNSPPTPAPPAGSASSTPALPTPSSSCARPVQALPGVGPKLGRALARYGIAITGELADLPLPTLQRIAGTSTARLRHERANGRDPRTVAPSGPPASITATRRFPADVLDPPDASGRAPCCRRPPRGGAGVGSELQHLAVERILRTVRALVR
ncbi:hypothetical protein [Kitasatospora sp. DSM 101779]|uniref:hypothetical protein n=1 Tax=Kitasatospora sp. DSM 101779 TaxID=2853165 RepID=UPI0021D97112|nr:hypothetical protein [Kitasatospora sp. DSM 101779]